MDRRVGENQLSPRLVRALGILREGFRRKVSLAEVAASVGHSPTVLGEKIRRDTGHTFTEHLRDLRMKEARRLLTQSALPIGQIARAIGYPHLPHFSRLFRREMGMSPREYRDRYGRPPVPVETPPAPAPPATLVFEDALTERKPGRAWTPLVGTWITHDGALRGTAEGDVAIALRHELPLGFLSEFEIRREGGGEYGQVTGILISDGGVHADTGYSFYFPDRRFMAYRLRRSGTAMAEVDGAPLSSAWHPISIVFHDNVLSFYVDGRQVLRYDELYPIRWRHRSYLTFYAWGGSLSIRSVRLSSLALASRREPIARADDRIVQGDPERALTLYEEALAQASGTDAETDLHLKIGLTYMDLGFSIRGRSYLDRFVARRADTVWGIVASFRSLQTRLDRLKGEELDQTIERFLEPAHSPAHFPLALELLQQATQDCEARGDYDLVAGLSLIVCEAAPPLSYQAAASALVAAGALFTACRNEEAITFAQEVRRSARLTDEAVPRFRLALLPPLLATGRYDDATATINEVVEDPDRHLRAMALFHRGILAQARGEPDRAAEEYRRILHDYPDVPAAVRSASIRASQLLALAGRAQEAQGFLQMPAEPVDADSALALLQTRWSLLAIARDYGSIRSSVATRFAPRHDVNRQLAAEQLLLAIVHELCGDSERATRVLEATERLGTDSPMWRWVLPASYLLGRSTAEELRKNTRNLCLFSFGASSSSLFCMLGLVEKHRGDRDRAREMFRLAVDTDPLNYWPAILARRELGMLTPGMKKLLGKR